MNALGYFMDFILHVDAHLFELANEYGIWIYAILFLIIFCETGLVVTPFLPGDSLLFAAGVVAGAGLIGLGEIILILLLGGILGDAVNYLVGRKTGPAIFKEKNRLFRLEYLRRAQKFYERHGGKAIMLARFVPVVRTFAPFVAGMAHMRPAAFFIYNVAGCILWVCGLVCAGHYLGAMPWVRANFSLIVILIVLLSLLPVLIESWRSWGNGGAQ